MGGRDLLADHDSVPAGGLKANGSAGRVMIGQKNGIEAKSPASVSDQFGVALGVERCRAMHVQIDPNQGPLDARLHLQPPALLVDTKQVGVRSDRITIFAR
ncbi:MAG: hypothetical protein DMF54_10610 [Acidobacteria bacterium]|nr:MAG: hypothetical protein DMF54_10610 [Acidobacteriota bacterium]